METDRKDEFAYAKEALEKEINEAKEKRDERDWDDFEDRRDDFTDYAYHKQEEIENGITISAAATVGAATAEKQMVEPNGLESTDSLTPQQDIFATKLSDFMKNTVAPEIDKAAIDGRHRCIINEQQINKNFPSRDADSVRFAVESQLNKMGYEVYLGNNAIEIEWSRDREAPGINLDEIKAAREVREAADNRWINENSILNDRTTQYIENTIEPAIKDASVNGKFNIEMNDYALATQFPPKEIDKAKLAIADRLERKGFDVDFYGDRMNIEWKRDKDINETFDEAKTTRETMIDLDEQKNLALRGEVDAYIENVVAPEVISTAAQNGNRCEISNYKMASQFPEADMDSARVLVENYFEKKGYEVDLTADSIEINWKPGKDMSQDFDFTQSGHGSRSAMEIALEGNSDRKKALGLTMDEIKSALTLQTPELDRTKLKELKIDKSER